MNWIQRLFLFGRTSDFQANTCITCNVYKEQLEYEREVNKELTETLSSLLRPAPIVMSTDKPQLVATPKGTTWARRRVELERADREAARIRASSPVIAKSDDEIKELRTVSVSADKVVTIDPNIIPPSTVEELEKDLLIDTQVEEEKAAASAIQ